MGHWRRSAVTALSATMPALVQLSDQFVVTAAALATAATLAGASAASAAGVAPPTFVQ